MHAYVCFKIVTENNPNNTKLIILKLINCVLKTESSEQRNKSTHLPIQLYL